MQTIQKSLFFLGFSTNLITGIPRQRQKSATVLYHSHPSLLQLLEFIPHPQNQTWRHMGSAELEFEFIPSHHLSSIHGTSAIPPCSCRTCQIVGGKQHFLHILYSGNF